MNVSFEHTSDISNGKTPLAIRRVQEISKEAERNVKQKLTGKHGAESKEIDRKKVIGER